MKAGPVAWSWMVFVLVEGGGVGSESWWCQLKRGGVGCVVLVEGGDVYWVEEMVKRVAVRWHGGFV